MSQPVAIWSKVRVEKAKQSPEGAVAGSLYIGSKIQWVNCVRKLAELEFPLIPLGVAITQGSKWKAKRAADWEESAGWKFLTTSHSSSVEQLQEMIVEIEMQGVELVKSPAWEQCLEWVKLWQLHSLLCSTQ